jgi:NAD-dependent DNA ligase
MLNLKKLNRTHLSFAIRNVSRFNYFQRQQQQASFSSNSTDNDNSLWSRNALKEKIAKLNHAYYVQGKPLISDGEYDRLVEQLDDEIIDLPIGSNDETPSAKKMRVAHLRPMRSLQSVRTNQDVVEFLERIANTIEKMKSMDEQAPESIDIIMELKYDGMSASLLYNLEGKLEKGFFCCCCCCCCHYYIVVFLEFL